MNNLYLALSLTSIILCAVTAIFSVLAYSKVVGLENSTHQVQWMPMEDQKPEDIQQTEQPEKESELSKQFRKHMYPDINDEQV